MVTTLRFSVPINFSITFQRRKGGGAERRCRGGGAERRCRPGWRSRDIARVEEQRNMLGAEDAGVEEQKTARGGGAGEISERKEEEHAKILGLKMYNNISPSKFLSVKG